MGKSGSHERSQHCTVLRGKKSVGPSRGVAKGSPVAEGTAGPQTGSQHAGPRQSKAAQPRIAALG